MFMMFCLGSVVGCSSVLLIAELLGKRRQCL